MKEFREALPQAWLVRKVPVWSNVFRIAGQPTCPQQPSPTAARSSAGPEGSPVSDLKISDPVLTLTLARGVEKGGLFELLDALVDLPAMRAHQRAAVVMLGVRRSPPRRWRRACNCPPEEWSGAVCRQQLDRRQRTLAGIPLSGDFRRGALTRVVQGDRRGETSEQPEGSRSVGAG